MLLLKKIMNKKNTTTKSVNKKDIVPIKTHVIDNELERSEVEYMIKQGIFKNMDDYIKSMSISFYGKPKYV